MLSLWDWPLGQTGPCFPPPTHRLVPASPPVPPLTVTPDPETHPPQSRSHCLSVVSLLPRKFQNIPLKKTHIFCFNHPAVKEKNIQQILVCKKIHKFCKKYVSVINTITLGQFKHALSFGPCFQSLAK